MRVAFTKFRVLGLCLLILVACNDDDEGITSDQVLVGENYFPLAMGQVKIYQVDSILYDDFNNNVDTLSFHLKEEVTGTFVDEAGRTNFVTTLSFRTDSTANWTVIKNFTQVKLRQRIEIMEENVTIVPLIFPFAENKRWDANAFNDFEEQTFRYKNLYQTFQFNQQSFDSVATVAQIDSENLIQRIFSEEKYAPNQGLIYRKSLNLNTEINGEIRSGYEATISLIEIQRP